MRIQRTTRLTPLHIATGFLLGGFSLSTAHGQASFQGLGDLPGGSFRSFASYVSVDGSVVVGASISAASDPSFEAFSWTIGSGMVGLGDLPGGTISSAAFSVSSDGSVVTGWGNGDSIDEAFMWTSGGGMVGLGDLPGGDVFSAAAGMSNDGSVVVGMSISALSHPSFEAFRWTSGGGMVGLGANASIAHDVSADGTVVVGSGSFISGSFAFRWTSGGGMVDLGALPGGGWTAALAVSADGKVVIGRGGGILGREAFRWTSGSGMVVLGDLPGGEFLSEALDTSADGSVVVGYGATPLGFEAFIWDETNGMQNLQAVLENQLGLNLTGWTLTKAVSVSADGTTIVGEGKSPNTHQEGFIAVIPGPNVCPGDILGLDGNVNVTDLLSLLAGWGPNPGHPADINGDGSVNVTDLLTLLAAWGPCS